VSHNKLDRIKIFAGKLYHAKKKSFSDDSARMRKEGPRILANSIPKAGTHLMESALNLIPGIVFSGDRTLMDWEGSDLAILKKISRLKRGQFANAHLPASDAYLRVVEEHDIRVLMTIRDPRDVIVSHAKYVNEIDKTHRSHHIMAALPDDDARLMAVICGVDGFIAPVDELWRRYQAWFEHPSALVIKFEDMVGAKGGGSSEAQLETVQRVVAHLGLDLSEEIIRDVSDNIFNPKAPTFRKGVTGNWKKHFKEEHIQAFMDRTGDLLSRLGYE